MNNIIVYSDGELELNVSINNETTWLNRNQISKLLDRDVKTIGKHISNIFKEKELIKNSVIANFATTATDGKIYNTEHYNLDVVISIGYRVKLILIRINNMKSSLSSYTSQVFYPRHNY